MEGKMAKAPSKAYKISKEDYSHEDETSKQ